MQITKGDVTIDITIEELIQLGEYLDQVEDMEENTIFSKETEDSIRRELHEI